MISMATNSILHNVTIKNKTLAKSFVHALESAAGKQSKVVTMSKKVKEVEKDKIKSIFSK